MPITPDRLQKLRQYGLSDYGARAYLALLDLGASDARGVSEVSRVPPSKVYRVLETLHERGLVDVLPSFPRRFAPVPFDVHAERTRRAHVTAAELLAQDRDALRALFAPQDAPALDRGGVALLRGAAPLEARAADVLATCDEALLLDEQGAGLRGAFGAPLRAALARGLPIRALLPPTAPLAGATVRAPRSGGAAASILVTDGASLVVHLADDGTSSGLHLTHAGFLAVVRRLAESAWQAAAPTVAIPLVAPPSPPPFQAR